MKLDLKKIPVIYINLEHHTDKNESMINMLNHCGFENIIRVEGVINKTNSVAGCAAAHYKALTELDPPFIIFEDDCHIKDFISELEVPDNSDAIYLGVSGWGRMNSHSGPFVQYEKIDKNLCRIYNMLGAHAILYLSNEYVEMCKKIAYHAAYIIEDHQDIGFAEIQRWFNIYCLNDPYFYQTSSYEITKNPLTSYHTEECFQYNKNYFLPEKIV